ncbi:hypothetical protein DFQ28_002132 [Apophysomyces sp. BC1034]|nr:hypothetical protein DFQ29_001630 [Apophysomyces sp. BC1021]KAG0190388.1 hypothetical protein DFQ28_002132 [Apophysomyces sp. BC1034]
MYPQHYAYPQSPLHTIADTGVPVYRPIALPPCENTLHLPCLPATYNAVLQQQQQQVLPILIAAAPPEPLPSATDLQPMVPLTIPEIAEFASSMVHLMWHARRPSVMALHSASASIGVVTHTDDQNPTHRRETASIAGTTSSTFKKFSEQILQATQLSESVVVLSLKYIAMLLQNNPNIQGAEGSEFRLFTVALMLANKFLDDNTFTNKTWSEISGMNVADLGVMEFEFLDVLQFRMCVRKDEFERWKVALFTFRHQLQAANRAEEEERQQMIETTLKGMGLSMLQQPKQSTSWATHTSEAIRHQTQQHYHHQYLYLLSKAQQPHFPTQPLSQPLVRVPLRIPVLPVYRGTHSSNNTSQVSATLSQASAVSICTPPDGQPDLSGGTMALATATTVPSQQATQLYSNITTPMSNSFLSRQTSASQGPGDGQFVSQYQSRPHQPHVPPPPIVPYGAQAANDQTTFYQQQQQASYTTATISTEMQHSNESLSHLYITHRQPSLDVPQIAGPINLTSQTQDSQTNGGFGDSTVSQSLFHYAPPSSTHGETSNGYYNSFTPYPSVGSSFYAEASPQTDYSVNGMSRSLSQTVLNSTELYSLPPSVIPTTPSCTYPQVKKHKNKNTRKLGH